MRLKHLTIIMFLLFFTIAAVGRAEKADEMVVVVDVSETINAGTVRLVGRALGLAEDNNATLILRINTYGGLLSSMDEIIDMLLASRVKVIAYVYPVGGKAVSAGAFIAMSSDILVMAPDTVIGACKPIPPDEKVVSYASSRMKMLAERRYGSGDPRVELAVAMVLENRMYTYTEALEKGLIDFTSPGMDDLLAKLGLADADVVYVRPNIVEEFYSVISEPMIIYLLLELGILLVIFELLSPGTTIAGAAGLVMVLLALIGISVLKPGPVAIFLLILSAALFVLELKKPGVQVFGIAGVITLLIAFFVIYGEQPYKGFRVPEGVIFVAVSLIGGAFVFYMQKISSIMKKKPLMDLSSLVGASGVAKSDIKPGEPGVVLVASDLWTAYSSEEIKAGEEIEVVKVEGLRLYVRRKG